VVPFGLQGASSILMLVMNQALTVGLGTPSAIGGVVSGASGPLGRCEFVCMDDCLVHSPTLKEQHLLDVAEVLETFRRIQLYAKSSKCEFGPQELAFLGHASPRRGCRSTRARCSPSSSGPRRRRAVKCGASRPGQLRPPIRGGLRRDRCAADDAGRPAARFVRSPDAQASFDALKRALSSAQVLHTFDPSRRAVLTTDANSVAVAAILTQPDDEGLQHPIAYESRKLTAAKRNYPAHVLELLAVVHALRVFKHYLLGNCAPRPARVLVRLRPADGQPGDRVAEDCHLNKMHVRWLDEIENVRFDVTPAGLAEPGGPPDALRLRGWARTGGVDGGP
jgi:hypothetical protein